MQLHVNNFNQKHSLKEKLFFQSKKESGQLEYKRSAKTLLKRLNEIEKDKQTKLCQKGDVVIRELKENNLLKK